MKRIAVAGGSGFIGGALLRRDWLARAIPRDAWRDAGSLAAELSGTDAVICCAGASRMPDPAELYRINLEVAERLVAACEVAGWTGRIVFVSTTHEAKDTLYHASKRDSRRLFDEWAARRGGEHVGVLLPNTFGPGGKPFFNSAVATFAWQTAHGETPRIDNGGATMQLCYIDTVVAALLEAARVEEPGNPVTVAHQFEATVRETAERLARLHGGGQANDGFDRALAITLNYFSLSAV